MLMAEAKDVFETLKKACLEAPVLAFADFNKSFLPETNASKLGLGAVLSQNRLTVDIIWWHMPANSYLLMSTTITQWNRRFSTKVGDCQAVSIVPPLETIHYQSDNNLLTYIMNNLT